MHVSHPLGWCDPLTLSKAQSHQLILWPLMCHRDRVEPFGVGLLWVWPGGYVFQQPPREGGCRGSWSLQSRRLSAPCRAAKRDSNPWCNIERALQNLNPFQGEDWAFPRKRNPFFRWRQPPFVNSLHPWVMGVGRSMERDGSCALATGRSMTKF